MVDWHFKNAERHLFAKRVDLQPSSQGSPRREPWERRWLIRKPKQTQVELGSFQICFYGYQDKCIMYVILNSFLDLGPMAKHNLTMLYI